MSNLIRIPSLILLLACFSGVVFSQTVGKKQLNFVSKEGGFTIALPVATVKNSSVESGEGFAAKGTQFTWDDARGFYKITFSDLIEELEKPEDFLKIASQLLTENAVGNGGKLLGKKELSLNGNPGLETKVQLKGGTIAINRTYIVKKRVYTLFSGWKKEETGAAQLKVLDSFKLLNANLIVKPVK